ncbi:MAG: hypothetical protein H7282_04890 [Cytophagaceae bacterium]|nr:hypothetical protein [Cytophagaceae bacterium]
MLLDSPGKTIRLYVATPGNEMWKNSPNHSFSDDMSIGFHPHHCDLKIVVLHGALFHWLVTEVPGNNIKRFKYDSKIKTGKIKFISDGTTSLTTDKAGFHKEGDVIHLAAASIHTVCCSVNQVTAWMVFEGKSDPNYKPVCYSNHDLTKADFSELYQPMTKELILATIARVDL